MRDSKVKFWACDTGGFLVRRRLAGLISSIAMRRLCSLILDGVGGPATLCLGFDLSRLFRLVPTNWTRERSLSALHALYGSCAVAADLYYRCDHREIDARHDELMKSICKWWWQITVLTLVRFFSVDWRFFDCDAPGCRSGADPARNKKSTTARTANRNFMWQSGINVKVGSGKDLI